MNRSNLSLAAQLLIAGTRSLATMNTNFDYIDLHGIGKLKTSIDDGASDSGGGLKTDVDDAKTQQV